MTGHGRQYKTRKSYSASIFMVFVFSVVMAFGIGEKTYAASAAGSVKQEGLVDRAWKFIGNMSNVFFEEMPKIEMPEPKTKEIEREIEKTEPEAKAAEPEVKTNAAVSDTDYMILVNANNSVERNYKAEEMIDIAKHVPATKAVVYLEKQAAESYIKMDAAMKEDGITGLAAVSGYRDYDYQSRLHNAEINRQKQWYSAADAKWRAARIVAAPGTSEHQTGLAIDVSSWDIGYVLSAKFADAKNFAWLKANAHEYGFIIRYDRDKTDITGVIYEPWHLRYVGNMAGEIYESGLCLEEFLALD